MKLKFKAWPFKEAQRIINMNQKDGLPDTVVFQTGFGPSGLPHIGTFGEVARTTWVLKAYEYLSQKNAKLYYFLFLDHHYLKDCLI